MRAAIIVCAAIGIVTTAATLAIGHAKPERATEEYGRRLMNAMAPHRLACSSCHIDAGAEPGDLTLVNAVRQFPGDRLIQRIDECITRNMNSPALEEHSDEMTAIVAWLRFVAGENALTRPRTNEPVWQQTDHTPVADSGGRLFEKRCADCHGKDGAGLAASRDPAGGYLFPPLWGAESFPDTSEMQDTATLARFIQAKMPLGRADLSETDAWDVAAYIASKPRPHSAQ